MRSTVDYISKADDRAVINTDLAFILPRRSYWRIASNSGLCGKHKIDIAAGVLYSDYRGNVEVVLISNVKKDFDEWKGINSPNEYLKGKRLLW